MKDSGSARISGFVGMWTVIWLIAMCAQGFHIINKNKTKMYVGILLGVTFIIAQQLLIVFAIFVERGQLVSSSNQGVKSSAEAMAAFCFLMFLGFSLSGMFIYMFRAHVIKVEQFNALETIRDPEADRK
jgi:hypothetical protein